MARTPIFLSKRLVRFAILVIVFLFIILNLGSQTKKVNVIENKDDYRKVSGTGTNIDGIDKIDVLKTVASAAAVMADSQKNDAKANLKAGEAAEIVPPKHELTQKEKLAAVEASIKKINPSDTMSFINQFQGVKGTRPKACFVTLVRNSELHGLVDSIRMVEKRFNAQFKYDWIFLNDEPFTEEFKKTVQKEVSSTVKFGLIPEEHWSYPNYIDQTKAAKAREDMAHIIYGSSESYRHMCRYQSGFFWRHPLLDEYDWYWRVEPDIKLYCDINYDVFQWMQDHEKVYGFTITIHEYEDTIKTLWKTSMDFFKQHSDYLAKDNLMKFLSDDNGKTYNLCHFWSNFEIANLNLWRSPAYKAYFDYLDHAGGFFYERWGDAPVHSIAAALIIPQDKLHYFSDIGYHHVPYDNCPLDPVVFKNNNCDCDQGNDFTFQSYSCGKEYFEAAGLEKPEGWEKYRD
ncbi:glycolipid 2-alpha-mannosyltransferase [Monosporozyma unispora]|nr:hypothetical protein C6P44_002330 [Kazachstania unispora]